MGILKNISSFIKRKLPSYKTDDVNETIDNFQVYEDRSSYIADICEKIIEGLKKQEELKVEYEIVTFYLTDMQRIDRIPTEQREGLNKIANSIFQLTKERRDFQESTRKLSNRQYRVLMENEERMLDIIDNLKNNEEYNNAIKKDMEYLEGEKGSLFYEKEILYNRLKFTNWLAKVTCIWVVIILAVLLFLGFVQNVKVESPIIITTSIAAIFLILILFSIYRNRRKQYTISPKIKKAIRLLNRAKINFVNNKKSLDNICRKYMVRNSKELEYIWSQYLQEKEKELRYRKNTGQLNSFVDELIDILKKNTIEDPDIWIHQASALVDDKEMVEVRHGLNSRRQKIREELESYEELVSSSVEKLKELVEKQPESRVEVSDYLNKIGVNL
ncbi:MAG TPA: hypothetical protein GX705_02935 [Clostridiales bacterium]|nr:hypothetical protein [Clostridiales bacterium]